MLLLRCFSILMGSAVLFGAPFLLLPKAPTGPAGNGWLILAACGAILLVSSGYFFVGIAGHRMRRSILLRAAGALLLSFPLMASAWGVFSGRVPELLPAIGPVLCFTAFLFIAFVFPSARRRTYRPMRPRESSLPG